MPSTSLSTGFWAYSRSIVSIVIIANSFPFLGLLAFEWGLTELLIVYWLEGGIAIVVGIVKTFPARLVNVPLSNPQSEPLLKARHGTVSIGNGAITGYVRNASAIGGILVLYAFWTIPMLAFFVPSSPLYSSFHDSTVWLVVVAGLLGMTHVLTAKSYFDEKRYDQLTARGAAGFPLIFGMGMFGLVVILFIWHWSSYGPVLDDWPAILSYVTVSGKVGMDLFFRCRNRLSLERLDEDTNPFSVETSAIDVLLFREPGVKAAELPWIERPDERPRATIRPSRSRIVGASPLLGMQKSRDGAPIFFLAFTILLVVADVGLVLPLVTLSTAIVFAVLPIIFYTLPRHATLEYEFYDDQLVCHDYWLDEPVWNLSYDDVESVSVERGLAARVGGYGTVVLETTDGDPAKLAYLPDYQDVADRLERTARVAVQ